MPATWSEVGSPEKLPQSASTALYRICQEALRNVRKHAGETHVKVTLESEDDNVRMRIRDFGIGFDQDTEYPTRVSASSAWKNALVSPAERFRFLPLWETERPLMSSSP